MGWKKHKKAWIGGLLLVVVLLAAFWFGGNNPDSRGWSVEKNPTQQEATTQQEETQKEENLNTESDQAAEETKQEEKGDSQKETADQETSSGDAQAGKPAQKPSQPEKPSQPSQPSKPSEPVVTPTCKISISCATILNNMDQCDPAKQSLVPSSGWILRETTVPITPGESVMDVLQRVCREKGIHLEYTNTPVYHSSYVEGIANLYEFDVGELSGWMYRVNGVFPNYGCSQYSLKDGDVICWMYTCSQGADIGGSNF